MPENVEFAIFRNMKNIEYGLLRGLFFVFSHVSFKTGKRLALLITFLVEKILRYRRTVILKNLEKVYGENLPMPQNKLLHEIYKNFVFLWMEVLQTNRLTAENFKERLRFQNLEFFEELKKSKQGILFISGHFGNFEWLGQGIALLGFPVTAIAKRQSNAKVDAFINAMRQRNGMKIVYTKQAMRQAQNVLNKKEAVAIAFDQDARDRGVFVNFLGIPSSTAVGTAVLHLRTAAKIVLLIAVRRDYALFDVYAEEVPIPPLQGSTDEKIVAITQSFTTAFEKWVLKYPEQWFWMHRRWKTQPPVDG